MTAIYLALHDAEPSTKGGNKSWVVGAFSTEEKAQAACQEDANADNEVSGLPLLPLAWRDAEAQCADGSDYAVILVDLDVAQG